VGECDLEADQIIAHPAARRRQKKGKQVAALIKKFLAGGPRDSDELDRAMQKAGFSKRAIREGRTLVGVRTRKEGFGKEGRWVVELPPGDAGDDEADCGEVEDMQALWGEP
jgi:hypothetical protein